MHDGRFGSLESVLNHYSNSVTVSETLDPILKQNGVLGIALSANDRLQLIAFLKTLSDNQYLNDSRFSDN